MSFDKMDSNEKALQKRCIRLFERLGYEYLSPQALEDARGGKMSEVLLRDILRERLGAINAFKFSQNALEQAINSLQTPLNENLARTNAKIADTLLLGESFSENVGGAKKSLQMKFIDFENPQNNAFHIAEEVALSCAVQNERAKTRRADLVLFINGIAVAVLELKNANKDHKIGIRQLLMYQQKEQIPQLFRTIAICVAGNNHNARYGTVGTSEKFYALWKEPKENLEKLNAKLGINYNELCGLERLICSLFEPERFLRLIRHYVFVDNGVKKIARYQQFFAVERILKQVGVFENGKRKGGLIWHTQGSGKSITMVFLTKLLKAKFPQSKVLIITDRVDLDRQIEETFRHSEVNVKKAKSGANLVELLQSGAEIITAVVHKFETSLNLRVRLESRDIFVLIDEAHRSHARNLNKDSEKSLHERMKKTLPNACYIGFTGTPLLQREKNRFGEILHKYTIRDGVEDGAIVPLVYDGRLEQQKIPDKKAMDERFDDISIALDDKRKEALRAKWASFRKVASAKDRLVDIALDIARHFELNLRQSGFKAMLATDNKFDAIRYYEIFDELTPLKCALVISNNEQEGLDEKDNKKYVAQNYPKILGGKDEREYEKWAISEFSPNNKRGEIDLLIVVDKLLTGFDAPRAKVLYVDKHLKEHSLLQAIARVNRIYEGKDCGIIMDYRGLLGNLERALNSYDALSGFDEGDLEQTLQDISNLIQDAKNACTRLGEFFSEVSGKDANAHCEFLMFYADDLTTKSKEEFEKEKEEALKIKQGCFKTLLGEFARSFFTALGSEKIKKLLSEKEIADMKRKIAFYNLVRDILQQRIHEELGLDEYEGLMQQLLDTYVKSGGINKLGAIQNIFDDDFEAQVSKILGENKTPKAVADSIISAVGKSVQEKFDDNPAFYGSLSKRIEKLLDDYEKKRIDDSTLLGEARTLAKDLKDGIREKNYPNTLGEKQGAKVFYDNIAEFFNKDNNGALGDILDEKYDEFCVNFALFCDEIYSKARLKPQWQTNQNTRREITLKLTEKRFEFDDKFGEKFTKRFGKDEFDELDKMLRKIALASYKEG